MQIRKYRTKHFFKQNRSLQKFANIRRNIFPNSEAGFSFSKRLYTSVSLEYWNYFFFFFADWYTVEYMKAKLAKNFCNFKNSKRFLRLFVEFDRFSSCSSKSINLEYWNYFSLSPIARKCTTKDS